MLETGFTSFSQTAAALTSVAVARGSAGSLRPAGWPPAKQGLGVSGSLGLGFGVLAFEVDGFGLEAWRALGIKRLGFKVVSFGLHDVGI